MGNIATLQTTNLPSLNASPSNPKQPTTSQNAKSFISFQLQSNKLNEQSQTVIGGGTTSGGGGPTAANVSNVTPFGSQSPIGGASASGALPLQRQYEKPKEKFMRKAHESLQKGKEIQMENCYNLKNYRLENKKFPVGLPGEKKAIFFEKPFEDREKRDN